MLQVNGLVKAYRGKATEAATRPAVDGVSFEVAQGQMFTLLGPSGCGKTTTLRCVAGLETPDKGTIVLDGRTMFSAQERAMVPAFDRGIGMVFQSYAIWPHMNVRKNVSFPLEVMRRSQRPSRRQIQERVERALKVVQLEAYVDRPATNLSGGQQQRLALARALVMEPALLLLDEPLSNLDAKLREELRVELKRLQRDIGVTTAYVTHDQVEALTMSNVIAVMNDGKVEQIGKPREIYERPSSRFVSGFIGSTSFVDAVVVSREPEGDNRYRVKTAGGTLVVSAGRELALDDSVTVTVRPENISLHGRYGDDAPRDGWPGEVLVRSFIGECCDYRINCGGLELTARCNPSVDFRRGDQVYLTFPPDGCWVVAA